MILKKQQWIWVKISNEFNNQKTILGKNLAILYEYNIKEHKEFYDYIERLYDKILIKRIN